MEQGANISTAPTLFALASAPGRSGVSVYRISGEQARDVFEKICRPQKTPAPRHATLRNLHHPETGELIDHALVIWFPAPHSFTGEDVVELHCHGGRAIETILVEALASLPGFEVAPPGAYSRRAFENGKLDLTEAEAIADLVDAETSAQRRQALRQMDGALGALYHGWAARLTERLAYIEAEIDFADEELPTEITKERLDDVQRLIEEITDHLDDNHKGERLREGLTIALLGAPNAGKSSILNALARREAAIVDPTPGTTRDIIEVHLDLGGYPVTLADTAGLRESADRIENEGIRRALARAQKADFRLLVFDGGQGANFDTETKALLDENALVLINKKDLWPEARTPEECFGEEAEPLVISAKTGDGLDGLTKRLIKEIDLRFTSSDAPALTRARHRKALEECLASLKRAVDAPEVEFCAEDIRIALRSLGRITGRVDVEDLLDVIFSQFCIGK